MMASKALCYLRARYYHTDLQRFISEDPIGFAGGDIDLYAYVNNSPLRFVDPVGLDYVDFNATGGYVGGITVGAMQTESCVYGYLGGGASARIRSGLPAATSTSMGTSGTVRPTLEILLVSCSAMLFFWAINVAFKTGRTAEEIAVSGKLADAVLGLLAQFLPITKEAKNSVLPGMTSITSGDVLGTASLVSGVQTLFLGETIVSAYGADAAVGAATAGGVFVAGGLAFLGGYEIWGSDQRSGS